MAIVEGQNIIWITRLDESLGLLDEIIGDPCECEMSWPDGVVCIQCHARKVQRCVRKGRDIANDDIKDAYEQVICHVNDHITLDVNHELESVRYWASEK